MNVERLRNVVEAIAAQPQAFDMGLWHCDTHACFAGHAVDLMAKEQGLPVMMLREDHRSSSYACRIGDGPEQTWRAAAMQYLDLTVPECDRLFDTDNWPADDANAYEEAFDRLDYVGMVGALRDRVEYFIAHGE